MPPDATTRGLDSGTRAEVRVAQAWFWDGYYVRRGIDLQHRFGSDVSTVTDLDLLAHSFDTSLLHHKYIGEVKTGTSKNTPRPLDRALWLRGLRDLVGAEGAEITTAAKTSGPVRDACRRLGVMVQHLDDLTTREQRLRVADVNDVGSQGETVAVVRTEVQQFVKTDPILERGYWFLISEVWFLEPFDALKRTLGLIRELSKTWPPDSHLEANKAARWLLAEAVSIVTLHLAIVAGEANTMDRQTFTNSAFSRLSSGDIPYYALRTLSDRVDDYVGKLLASVNAPPEVRASALGGFLPVPPEYAEPLLELVSRLAAEAATMSLLSRQLDVVVFERLVRRRELTPELRSRLGLSPASERLIRLIAAFLRGQFALPEAVDKVLTAPLAHSTNPDKQVEQAVPPTAQSKHRPEIDGSVAVLSDTAPVDSKESPQENSKGVGARIEGTRSAERESDDRLSTKRWNLVLENNMDVPAIDVEFHYETEDGALTLEFDVLADRHHRTDVLGPHESVAFPLVQAWGSPSSAVCVVEWTDADGVRHQTRSAVRAP